MPYETDFDTAFTILLGKAQGTIAEVAPAPIPTGGGTTIITATTNYIVAFMFGGGGSALSTTTVDPYLVEVPDPGEIVSAHTYAGNSTATPVAVTATVDLQRTSFTTFGGSSPVYGSGTPPRLQADSIGNASLSGWFTHLDTGDTLIARLSAFSGTATWVALMLRVRRDASAQQQFAVLDASGDPVLDASGNPVIFRS